VFVGDVAVDADRDEPQRLVQADRGVVGEGDARARLVIALAAEQRKQRLIQRPADAAAVMVR